jgi:hypothetical protein
MEELILNFPPTSSIRRLGRWFDSLRATNLCAVRDGVGVNEKKKVSGQAEFLNRREVVDLAAVRVPVGSFRTVIFSPPRE